MISERVRTAQRLIDLALPRGGYLVGLYEAYFDESGTHDGSPLMCLAGYLIEAERAKRMTDAWLAALNEYGIREEGFHMVDCDHQSEHFARLTKQECIEVETRLIKIIKEHVELGIAVSLDPALFVALMPYHPQVVDAYYFTAMHCLEGVAQWADRSGYAGDIAFTFEAGHRSEGITNQMMSRVLTDWPRLHYVSHNFVRRSASPLVQSADLLAWQYCKQGRRLVAEKPMRKDFAALLENTGQHQTAHIDAKWLLKSISTMMTRDAWGDLQFRGSYYTASPGG